MKTFALFLILSIAYLSASAQWERCKGTFATKDVYQFTSLNNKFYAGTKSGILRSEDGIHWNDLIETGYPITQLYNFEQILFGVYGYNHLIVIYSNDQGESWKTLNTDTLKNFTRNIFSLLYDKGSIFLATGKGIYKTSDWGVSWKLITNKVIGNNTIHSKIVRVQDRYYAMDGHKKLYYSEDWGRTWEQSSHVKNNLRKIYENNGRLYAIKYDENLYQLNDEDEWIKILNKESGFIACLAPFCCNSFFVSSNKNYLLFNNLELIEFPALPINKEYRFAQAAYIGKDYLILSILKHGIWYIPFKFDLIFE